MHDRFVDEAGRRACSALKVGPATEPASQIGPMINARAVDEDRAPRRRTRWPMAPRCVTGGNARAHARDGPNYVRAHGAHRRRRRDGAAPREETFGPVAPVFRFRDEAEVIAAANDTPVRPGRLLLLARHRAASGAWRDALEAGIVGINEGAIAAEAAPFGGVKESGYGREGSAHGLDDYMRTSSTLLPRGPARI